jgi:hypothetical protein
MSDIELELAKNAANGIASLILSIIFLAIATAVFVWIYRQFKKDGGESFDFYLTLNTGIAWIFAADIVVSVIFFIVFCGAIRNFVPLYGIISGAILANAIR